MRQKLRPYWLPLILVTFLVLFGSTLILAAPGSIDPFDSDQAEASVSCDASPCTNIGATDSSPAVSDTSILGSERDIQVELTGGSQAGSDVAAEVRSGALFVENGPTILGRTEVQWDGSDGGAATLNPTGLGGVDLTAGGSQDAFLLTVSFKDNQRANIEIRVYTDNTSRYSTYTLALALPTIPSPGENRTILFSDFTPVGGGADFSDVGAVTLVITSPDEALDIVIDSFGTTGPPPTATPTPEDDDDELPTPRPRVEAPTASSSGGGGGGGGATPPAAGTPAALDFPIMLPETGEFPPINRWSFNPWPLIITGLVLAMAVGLWLNAKRSVAD